MKERMKQLFAALLVAIVIIVQIPPISISAAPATYSKQSNSGTRDEVCTSLAGTSAGSYYSGNYAYDYLDDLSSSALFSSLQTLMRSTHNDITSYNDCKYEVWKTDCENNVITKATTLYTSFDMDSSYWDGTWTCDREHVWPQSLGGDNTSGGGADLHHIRPAEKKVNGTRSNRLYGYAPNGTNVTGNNSSLVGGKYASKGDGGYFEPLDNVKGDVARICLYVYVRWNSQWGAESITKVFQSVDVLLEWCELDPVDTWEMGRNEVIQNIQGNRNVFIDYPELAWLIFDRDIPNDMTTPSGEAKNAEGGNGGNSGGTTPTPTPDPDPTPSTIYELASTLNNGDQVVIGAPAHGKALSVQKVATHYNKGVDYTTTNFNNITNDEIFEVKVNSDGSYTFTSKSGTVIAMADEYASLNAAGTNDKWTLEPVSGKTGVFYVKNNGRGNYLEWFASKGNWSTYTLDNSDLVEISFYVFSVCNDDETLDCTHAETKLINKKDATCEEAGYTGDEQCKACKAITAAGEAIAQLEHKFGEAVIILEPTESTVGLSKKTCENCFATEFIDIPKLESDDSGTKTALIITGSSVGGVSVIAVLFFVLKKFVF